MLNEKVIDYRWRNARVPQSSGWIYHLEAAFTAGITGL